MGKKGLIFVLAVIFLWGTSSSPQSGQIGKKLDLVVKDEKVSAEISNVPLGEVAKEIGKKLGLRVELHGEIDQTRLVSVEFKELPVLDALQRLLRGANFSYKQGEKLSLVGFGDKEKVKNVTTVTSVQSVSGPNESRTETVLQQMRSLALSRAEKKLKKEESVSSGNRKTSLYPLEDEENSGNPWNPENVASGSISGPRVDSKPAESTFSFAIILDLRGQTVSALSSDLNYDASLLANPRVTIGSAAQQAGKDVIYNEIRPGLFRIGVVGLNQTAIPNGLVADITFDVLRSGQISVNVQPTASDPAGKAIVIFFRNGRITAG